MPARLRGKLDVNALTRALEYVVAHHEILRTTHVPFDGVLHQVIADPQPLELRCQDVSGGWEGAEALARQQVSVRFDLTKEPPIRFHLYRVQEDEHLFVASLHHIGFDAWSCNFLGAEIWAAYDAIVKGNDPGFPESELDFADFAVWHNGVLPSLREELGYWRRTIGEGVPPLALPFDRPRTAATRPYCATHVFQVPASMSSAVEAVAKKLGATSWMVYLAAYEIVLHRACKQDEFAIVSPVTTLLRAQRGNMIGPFMNLVPLPVDVRGNPSFAEVVTRARQVALDVWAHRLVPWVWLSELGSAASPLGASPVALFYAESMPINGELHAGDLDITWGGSLNDTTEWETCLIVWSTSQGTVAVFEYKTELFDAATIKNFVVEFERVLAAGIADPERTI